MGYLVSLWITQSSLIWRDYFAAKMSQLYLIIFKRRLVLNKNTARLRQLLFKNFLKKWTERNFGQIKFYLKNYWFKEKNYNSLGISSLKTAQSSLPVGALSIGMPHSSYLHEAWDIFKLSSSILNLDIMSPNCIGNRP